MDMGAGPFDMVSALFRQESRGLEKPPTDTAKQAPVAAAVGQCREGVPLSDLLSGFRGLLRPGEEPGLPLLAVIVFGLELGSVGLKDGWFIGLIVVTLK